MKTALSLVLLAASLGVISCGQTGPLYLPDHGPSTTEQEPPPQETSGPQ